MGKSSLKITYSLVFVVCLLVPTLTVVQSVSAQIGVTTPSVPHFDVRYETFSRDVAPTYGVEHTTGRAVLIQAGYTEIDRRVKVNIANQPFTPYDDSNGNRILLYYDVQWKEAFGSDNSWKTIPSGIWTLQVPDSDFTSILLGFKGYNGSEGFMALLDYLPGGQIDFQVKASIGYYTSGNVFVGKTSGWSSTQTLNITETAQTTPTPTSSLQTSQIPTATTNQPSDGSVGLNWINIVTLAVLSVIAVLLVFVVVYLRRRSAAVVVASR